MNLFYCWLLLMYFYKIWSRLEKNRAAYSGLLEEQYINELLRMACSLVSEHYICAILRIDISQCGKNVKVHNVFDFVVEQQIQILQRFFFFLIWFGNRIIIFYW